MATNTYVALDKVTVGSNTPSISFTSIPSNYTDLRIVCNVISSSANTLFIRFNNDSSALYSATRMSGSGSSAVSDRENRGAGYGPCSNYAYPLSTGGTTNHIIDVMNYANSTTNKNWLVRANSASAGTDAIVGLYGSTNPITTISFSTNGFGGTSTLLAGSTFSLYGIKAEGASGTKATGGAIYSDSTYFYHVFGATGTFTPLQSLSVDALVVGGGGGASIGGGGAGGLRSGTSLSVTAQNYTVTVGSGGANVSTNAAGGNGTSSTFSTITSSGGGGGGGTESITKNGQAGGSGGGGGINSTNSSEQVSGGSGNLGNYTPVEGYAGGSGRYWGLEFGGGGGGGASQVGVNVAPSSGVVSTLGNGGDGSSAYSSWGVATGVGQLISGTYYLAGGGGGGGRSATPGTGGAGGGGNGSVTTVGTNGTANTGGGGGGANQGTTRGNGGSGIVIVRYAK